LLHFSSDLSQTLSPPGAFGWDDTVSIVDRSLVPSYQGTRAYLLMTKYNNYAGLGGDGVNKIAILDPNDTETDARTQAIVMKEVISIAGLTPDQDFIGTLPNAVREWCINTAAVDPFTHSVLANSEDGMLYRWDLYTNTFSQIITLTTGTGEAYTPTAIGTDGTVYAVNNATLFAVQSAAPAPIASRPSGNTGLSRKLLGVAALIDFSGRSFEIAVTHQTALVDYRVGPGTPGEIAAQPHMAQMALRKSWPPVNWIMHDRVPARPISEVALGPEDNSYSVIYT
jgi:hypothetical protein